MKSKFQREWCFQVKKNLMNALEHERKLNQQILGRLDAQRDIIKEMTGMLIEKATRS